MGKERLKEILYARLEKVLLYKCINHIHFSKIILFKNLIAYVENV